ncbi:MAG: hypothetical protein LBN30_06020 [Oscillospiraceae bacterium]|jgi:hypothetical protein|nr:hypothetical protein [Oscillospiraceae bacterium]
MKKIVSIFLTVALVLSVSACRVDGYDVWLVSPTPVSKPVPTPVPTPTSAPIPDATLKTFFVANDGEPILYYLFEITNNAAYAIDAVEITYNVIFRDKFGDIKTSMDVSGNGKFKVEYFYLTHEDAAYNKLFLFEFPDSNSLDVIMPGETVYLAYQRNINGYFDELDKELTSFAVTRVVFAEK